MVKPVRLLLLCLFLVLVPVLGARVQAQPLGQTPEESIIHPDGVVDVKQLPPAIPQVPVLREIPRRLPDPLFFQQRKRELRAGGSASGAGAGATPQVAATVVASTVTAVTGIGGLTFAESGGYVPPDTQVAAGSNHVFEAVNLEGRIWLKTLGAPEPVSSFTLNSFFNLPASALLSDPKIRFDPGSNRWFVVVISYNQSFTSGAWRLAVSTSFDPTGTFVLYTFATSKFAEDFPAIGINEDKVVLTANAFRANSFLGTEFLVLNKADLLAGGAVRYAFFPPPQGLFTIQPAHSLSSTCSSPTTCTSFMAAVAYGSATSIRIWAVTGVPGVGSGVSGTTADLAIATLSIPPDAVQAGTSLLIDTNDNRLLDAVFRDGELWVTANSACTPGGDATTRACLRFTEILPQGTPAVAQDFDVGTVGDYYYYAALQLDNLDNLVTVFSKSSAAEFPSVYAGGQLATAAPDTFQVPVVLKAGEAPYGLIPPRWGDYSGAGIDPADQTKVWVAGEYALIDSTWGTWIAEITLQ